MHLIRCLGRLSVVSLLLATVAACECEESSVVIDDFQGCGDTGCGWLDSNGQPVETERTCHSAERGMVVPPASGVRKSMTTFAEEVHAVSNCPDGLRLVLTGDDGRQTAPFHLSATTSERDNAWYRVAVVVSVSGMTIKAMEIRNTVGAHCVVDQVRTLDTAECGG